MSKYRILRFFKNDRTSAVLIGHFDLKAEARLAAHEDQIRHERYDDLLYEIEWVDRVMTQEEIDEIFKKLRE